MARRKSPSTTQTNTAPESARGRLEREGGLEEHPIDKAEVNVSGSHVALYAWDDIQGRMVRIDRLTKAVMTVHATHMEYRGISDRLKDTVRLRGEDAMVTWRLFPRGCQDCD